MINYVEALLSMSTNTIVGNIYYNIIYSDKNENIPERITKPTVHRCPADS